MKFNLEEFMQPGISQKSRKDYGYNNFILKEIYKFKLKNKEMEQISKLEN